MLFVDYSTLRCAGSLLISLSQTIDLPRQVRQSRSASEANLKPVSALPLDDNSLIANLEAEYRKYKLLHGSISYAITNEPRETVMLRLSGFWNGWNSRWGLEKAETSAFETLVGGMDYHLACYPEILTIIFRNCFFDSIKSSTFASLKPICCLESYRQTINSMQPIYSLLSSAFDPLLIQ